MYDKNEKLFKACLSEGSNLIDINQVEVLLSQGADPNLLHSYHLFSHAEESQLFPLLHIIAKKENSVQVAKLLIQYGANIDIKDTAVQNSPLLTAIALGDRNLAEFFIQETVNQTKLDSLSNPDKGKECQNSPLVLVLKKDMDDIALLLIRQGADVNVKCRDKQTALHWACMLRKTEVIKELLNHGAEIKCVNGYGYSPYEYYVYDIKLIDIANPLKRGNSSGALQSNMGEFSDLYFHSDYYHYENYAETLALQNRIIKRNEIRPDIKITSAISFKGTVEKTMEERHEDIVSEQFALIEKQSYPIGHAYEEARLNILDETRQEIQAKFYKNAPLVLAVKELEKEKIDLLMQDKKLINEQDLDGFTALHIAAMRRDEALIQKLIAVGANSNIRNKYGRTPLDYYRYQIRATDFKESDVYGSLVKVLESGESEMPEFCLAYERDIQKHLVAPKRNKQLVNLSLFEGMPKIQTESNILNQIQTNQAPKKVNALEIHQKNTIISATGDGACLFNAVAIGFGVEVLSGRLDQYAVVPGYLQLLDEFGKHYPNFRPKSWENFKSWLSYYNNTRDMELILAPVLFSLNRKFSQQQRNLDEDILNELTDLVWKNVIGIKRGDAWFQLQIAGEYEGAFYALCPKLDNLDNKQEKGPLLNSLQQILNNFNFETNPSRENVKKFLEQHASALFPNLREKINLDPNAFQRGYSCNELKNMMDTLFVTLTENNTEEPSDKNIKIRLMNKEEHWDVLCDKEDAKNLNKYTQPLIMMNSFNAYIQRNKSIAAPYSPKELDHSNSNSLNIGFSQKGLSKICDSTQGSMEFTKETKKQNTDFLLYVCCFLDEISLPVAFFIPIIGQLYLGARLANDFEPLTNRHYSFFACSSINQFNDKAEGMQLDWNFVPTN